MLTFLVFIVTFSEFPTEADLEDFTEAAVEEEDEDEDDDEEGEEVVEDRDYYYDNFKGDDYNEDTPTEPGSEGPISEKEITHDVKGNHVVFIFLDVWIAFPTGKSQKASGISALKDVTPVQR